jgi:RimJ/RimL family protein N-acetyltransferase
LAVSLRKVIKKDWDYILKLRNKEEFRTFFYEQHTISKKEHYAYLRKQKSHPDFFNWIICYGKKDAGYLRISNEDISIIVDEKFQGKGIGTRALQLVENEAKKLGIKKLVGRIMIHNESSKQIFLNNNYKLKMYWYEKNFDNNITN